MKCISIIIAGFIFFINTVTGCLSAEQLVEVGYEQIQYQEYKKEFAMLKAVEDLNANMDFMLRMRKEVDAGTGLGWTIFVADKIPSQPVAVISIIARLDEPEIEGMCPRIVIEDMISDQAYDAWMERAISALASFRMVDPKEESIRQACLENIRKALEKSPLRKK